MKELIDKISSYNIFNFLFPGTIFIVFVNQFTRFVIPFDNFFIGAFISYFIGLIISRFGSLVIEPTLRKVGFLKFSTHSAFISASKNDSKIELLMEINNMYRNLVSLLVICILIKFYEIISLKCIFLHVWGLYILFGLILVLFIFSYRKQTKYITSRIENVNKEKD